MRRAAGAHPDANRRAVKNNYFLVREPANGVNRLFLSSDLGRLARDGLRLKEH
jgi:hypothetical protein